MNGRILLVEDEADLALIVSETLREQGYDVVTATDGIDGLEKFTSAGADIVVADVMMPRMDGFSMAAQIKRLAPAVPLIFLTAKSTVDDVEKGFDIGAGDYLKKPFELRELIVRIRALLRRQSARASSAAVYAIGQYTFNVATQTLTFGTMETVLSHFEARILEHLVANTGATVDATDLMIAVWQRDDPSNRNSLHGYIHKLRRALRHDPAIAIINQRGFGYMLAVKPARCSEGMP